MYDTIIFNKGEKIMNDFSSDFWLWYYENLLDIYTEEVND